MHEIFERLCDLHGITAYRFCKDTGVNASTISTWKKKKSLAGPDLAKTVCEYFNVSYDFLMTGKELGDKKDTPDEKEKRYMAYAKELMNMGVSLEKLKKLVDAADGLKED